MHPSPGLSCGSCSHGPCRCLRRGQPAPWVKPERKRVLAVSCSWYAEIWYDLAQAHLWELDASSTSRAAEVSATRICYFIYTCTSSSGRNRGSESMHVLKFDVQLHLSTILSFQTHERKGNYKLGLTFLYSDHLYFHLPRPHLWSYGLNIIKINIH